ncbi:hypothetical protein AAVH_25827 [Aphelenchoides avenae]|nr:hypothetical protein AAVH_25827 [Aphelenchus avenae]
MDHPIGYEYSVSGEKKDLLSTKQRKGRMGLWEATARQDVRGAYKDSYGSTEQRPVAERDEKKR